MNTRNVALLCVSLLLTLAAHAAPQDTPPLYARLALPPDGSRVIPMMLKSSGPPQTYNVVYLDTNGNGKFEASEKHLIPEQPKNRNNNIRCYYGGIALSPQKNQRVQSYRLNYTCYGGKSPRQYYSLHFGVQPEDRSRPSVLSGELRATPAPQKPPFNGAAGKPRVTIETKPDPAKPGQTGFGVTVGWLDAPVSMPGPALTATLTVKDAAHSIVHQTTKPLTDLGFG